MKSARKLLVVDDDDAFREAMELEFTDRGFQVIGAPDHRSALGLAAVHRPAFAVIDLRLAGERGLEVLKDIHERLPATRCVGESGVRSAGWSASSACSSRNRRSYSASGIVGASST